MLPTVTVVDAGGQNRRRTKSSLVGTPGSGTVVALWALPTTLRLTSPLTIFRTG